MTPPLDVLVVGAGPAGLALALQAHGHGARVRVIDRRLEPFRPSRALILHPRTLEALRPLGVTQALLAKADVKPTADLHAGNRVVQVRFSDLALPDTAFPHISLIRQMDAERVLAQALADRGVEVEYGTELVSARDSTDAARAVLRTRGRASEADFAFIAGCDGPASTVRSLSGIGWPGAPYPVEILLADVELDGGLADDRTHVLVGREGIAFAFRLGEQATWRLLFTRPVSSGTSRLPFGQPGPPVPAEELRALLTGAGLTATVRDVAWSARIRVQRRVADQFRRGRLFIAGDAAHAYSPATGQGMNAAIQDAANLGWKLAFAAAAPSSNALLLDSYESERRPVARGVLGLTHLAFWAEAGTGQVPALLRGLGGAARCAPDPGAYATAPPRRPGDPGGIAAGGRLPGQPVVGLVRPGNRRRAAGRRPAARHDRHGGRAPRPAARVAFPPRGTRAAGARRGTGPAAGFALCARAPANE